MKIAMPAQDQEINIITNREESDLISTIRPVPMQDYSGPKSHSCEYHELYSKEKRLWLTKQKETSWDHMKLNHTSYRVLRLGWIKRGSLFYQSFAIRLLGI